MPLATTTRRRYQSFDFDLASPVLVLAHKSRLSIKDMQTLLSQNDSLILMKRVRACCASATLFAVLAGAAPVCAPPTTPYLPENDETLKEYADLINDGFERYFSEMSEYSSCLDHARAELLAEAQAVSQLHREFLARVEALGIEGKAATNPSPP